MKKYVILLCVFLMPFCAFADENLVAMGGPFGIQLIGGSTPASGACSSPSDNLLDEGFEGTGYENTWSESAAGPNEDGSRPGSQSPTSLCSESLIVSTSSSTAMWSEVDEGTARATAYIRFYIYIETTVADNGVFIAAGGPIANIVNNVTYSWAVELNTYGGVYVKGRGSTTSTAIAITEDAWHYIDVYFVQNSATCWIKVDGGTQQTFTSYDSASQYYALGHLFSVPGSAMLTTYDLFAVNSSEIGSEP